MWGIYVLIYCAFCTFLSLFSAVVISKIKRRVRKKNNKLSYAARKNDEQLALFSQEVNLRK